MGITPFAKKAGTGIVNLKLHEPFKRPGDEGYFDFVMSTEECSSSASGWVCTRVYGHTGPHAAHGGNGIQFATWETPGQTIASEGDRDLFGNYE